MRYFLHHLNSLPSRIIVRLSRGFHNYYHSSNEAKTPSNIGLEAIEGFIEKIGIHHGSTLMVHSAWKQLNSGNFSIKELIESLLKTVGTNGTLTMPAGTSFSASIISSSLY